MDWFIYLIDHPTNTQASSLQPLPPAKGVNAFKQNFHHFLTHYPQSESSFRRLFFFLPLLLLNPTMSKESVVVLGSSGYVGTATIKTLAAKYTDKVNVRAGVRNPDTDKAKSLAADNVQVIKADLGDPASLDSAINDGDVVFGAFCTNVLPSSFLMAFLPLFFFGAFSTPCSQRAAF